MCGGETLRIEEIGEADEDQVSEEIGRRLDTEHARKERVARNQAETVMDGSLERHLDRRSVFIFKGIRSQRIDGDRVVELQDLKRGLQCKPNLTGEWSREAQGGNMAEQAISVGGRVVPLEPVGQTDQKE